MSTSSRSRIGVLAGAALALVAFACSHAEQLATPTAFLSCAAAAVPLPDSAQIGPTADSLTIGRNAFVFPQGAVSAPQRFRAAPSQQPHMGVVLTPPYRFKAQVTVRLSMDGCTPEEVGDSSQWSIWRFPGAGSTQGVKLQTSRNGADLTARTGHNSAYMIAN